MPESRRRKKKNLPQSAPASSAPRRKAAAASPPWYGALILAAFALGIAWLLVYYLSNGGVLGLENLGAGGNLAIGFGFIVVGLGLSTQWR